jgi:hypothetical protein
METPHLHPDDEARAIEALLVLDWMEFPFETSSQAVGQLLGCSPNDTTSIWKRWRERQRIELKRDRARGASE